MDANCCRRCCLHCGVHPPILDRSYIEWDDFAADLNQALEAKLAKRRNPEISALLLSWEENDLVDVPREKDDLAKVFKEGYGITSTAWKIPTGDSYYRLYARVLDFLARNDGSGNLLIIYYGGHGQSSDAGCHWRATLNADSAKLDWLPIQHFATDHAEADILFILDCCYAGSAVRGSTKGRRELIAACEKATVATGQSTANNLTFSRTLINHLEARASEGGPLSASDLHVHLVRTEKLRRSPFYAILPCASKSPIVLFPTRPSGNNSLRERRAESVLIHLHLSGEPAPEAWNEWLTTNIPDAIAKVEVGAVYKSHSTILVVSLSLDLWPFFPQKVAYSYIGIIRSENLYPRAATSTPETIRSKSVNEQTIPLSPNVTNGSDNSPSDRRSPRLRDMRKSITPLGRRRSARLRDINRSTSPPTKKRNWQQTSTTTPLVISTRKPTSSSKPSGKRSSTAWTPAEDNLLVAERVRGQGWQSIVRKFPGKTANACRKRHERLMEKRTMDGWDGERFEHLAREYAAVRREMWTILANRVGASWQVLESKCFEKGLKNIQAAARGFAGRGQQQAPNMNLEHSGQPGSRYSLQILSDSAYALPEGFDSAIEVASSTLEREAQAKSPSRQG